MTRPRTAWTVGAREVARGQSFPISGKWDGDDLVTPAIRSEVERVFHDDATFTFHLRSYRHAPGCRRLCLRAAPGTGHRGAGLRRAGRLDTGVAQASPSGTSMTPPPTAAFSALKDLWNWLSALWLRARYALVESDNSDGSKDQIDDFRVILNYDLQFSGKDVWLACTWWKAVRICPQR